jgi:hypothetical protein
LATSSSIPAVKANLLTLLPARTALANVQVSYGAPVPSPALEFIWLGDVDGTEEYLAMNVKQEDYNLDVVINATIEAPDQQIATERAFVFRDEIDAMLLADKTIGGAVIDAKVGGSVKLAELVSTDGMRRGANLTIQIVVFNQL